MARVRFFDRDGGFVLEIDGQHVSEVRSFSMSAGVERLPTATFEVLVQEGSEITGEMEVLPLAVDPKEADARTALKRVEWVYPTREQIRSGVAFCPWCTGDLAVGHKAWCPREAALKR